jgi:hypothetical protein
MAAGIDVNNYGGRRSQAWPEPARSACKASPLFINGLREDEPDHIHREVFLSHRCRDRWSHELMSGARARQSGVPENRATAAGIRW